MKKKLALVLLALSCCMVALFGLTACGSSPLSVSAPANVRIDANTMSVVWDKVDNADKYLISFNDGTEYPISSNSYACAQYVNANQAFTVKVSAKNSKTNKTSEPTVVSFSPLPKVDDLALVDDRLTWTPVNTATGYVISIDGQEMDVPAGASEYQITDTGRHVYKVRPIVAGSTNYYSVWSNAQTVTKLGTVDHTKIKYDVDNAKLTWNAITGATSYDVYINGDIHREDCTSATVDLACPNANFIVQIQPRSSNANTLAGELSEGKEFIFLNAVTNLRVDDGVLSWDEVAQADKYILKIGNQKVSLTEARYTKLTRGESLTVAVMAACNNEDYFSSWSDTYSFYLLQAPVIQWNSSLELDDGSAKNNMYWDAIANANGYTVRITSPSGTVSNNDCPDTQRTYAYDFLDVGTYKVELKAVADPSDASICDSPYSAAISVTRLAAPRQLSSGFITSNAQEVSKGFTVSFERVGQASGYRLFKEENQLTEIPATASQFRVEDVAEAGTTDEKTYNYKIQALGSNNMQNNKVVLSSLKSNSLAFQITVLATPQGASIEGFNYSFGVIERANGYAITTGAGLYDSNSTTFDLGKVLNAGNAEIRVCAKGNGSNVLASNYSAPIMVNRLDAPYNIRIDEADASESVLTCASITGAVSYNVVFDNKGSPMDVGSIENIRQYIETTGTSVYMEAVANQYGPDSVYYMTSRSSETVTFMKLETPTFGTTKFTNTQLLWNHSGNMNTAIYTPDYEVFDEVDNKYSGIKTGAAMNIEYLDGGKQYTFKVKRLGMACTTSTPTCPNPFKSTSWQHPKW